MLHPEKFVKLGIDPPKGVLCYGPPGTGKTLLARAVANRTDACFIRVIGSELVQKYVGEGARMVRELFQVKNCCILVFIPLIVTMPSYVKNKMFIIADGPFKEGLHCVF
jgi:26S proteasome regulatory subunit T1